VAGQTRPTVQGADELRRALRRMSDRLDDMEGTHASAGEKIATVARAIVPRVSGALADSIEVETTPEGSAVVAGSFLVPYAGVINSGWPARNIDAQPYLDEAAELAGGDAAAVYVDRVEDLVRTLDRETP
jgi:hypothetical protein